MALTLRTRLTVTTAAATICAAALLVVGLQLLLARQSATDSADALQSRLDAAAATVHVGVHGRPRVWETPSRVLDQELWIYDAAGRRIDGAPPPLLLRPTVLAMEARAGRAHAVVGGRFRVASRPVTIPGTRHVVAVVVGAMDLSPYEQSEQRGLRLSALLGLSIVVAAAAAAWVSAGSSLRHVGRMARLADDWREHNLSRRFALGPPRDELTELAHTLDRMLDRIGQALLAERRLTDEVAHELRTPLAAIRAEAELGLSNPRDHRMTTESLGGIIAGCDRMNASIHTMLTAARSAHTEDRQCLLRPALEQLISQIRPGGVHVSLAPVPVAWVAAAPAEVVTAAVSPLLDNALQHARSHIDISVHRHDQSLVVTVEDDGDGVSDYDRDRLFKPGWTARPDGTGFGLPLARRLARSVGGEIEAMPGDHGRFLVTLPHAS